METGPDRPRKAETTARLSGVLCRAGGAGRRVELPGIPRKAAVGGGAGRAGGAVSGGRRRAQRAPGQLAAPRQRGER